MNEEVPTILLRRCRERQCIRLKRDYLQRWKSERTVENTEAAYEQLLADFKKTDISTTSESVISKDNGPLPDSFPPDQYRPGVVLQIQDTWDISHSLFSQVNNLKDNLDLPRGMLRWVLSDGTSLIHAREIENIQGLDLFTPFGTKLLVKSCIVKHGMLQLSNQNTTKLGGDVYDLYGGDMRAELIKRISEQLDATTEPNSPLPTTTHNTRPINTHPVNSYPINTPPINTHPINHRQSPAQSSTDARSAAELSELNDVDMFDDDMNDFDDYDPMEEIENNLHEQQTIPTLDDDFVTTQPIQVRSRLSRLTEKPKTPELKRKRENTQVSTESISLPEPIPESTPLPTSVPEPAVKKEKNIVEDTVHWIDPSIWTEDEIEGVEIKEDGTTHVTFDALHTILKEMESDTFYSSIADTIIVRAKFVQMAKMRFSAATGFYALFDIGDPLGKKKETVRILIGNKLFMELLGLDPNSAAEFGEVIKDQKKARKILVPFDKRMRAKQLEVQLNVNIMEKELSDDGVGRHFVPPTSSLKVLPE